MAISFSCLVFPGAFSPGESLGRGLLPLIQGERGERLQRRPHEAGLLLQKRRERGYVEGISNEDGVRN